MIRINDIQRAQEGDREAFIRLIQKLEPEMYGVAKSILKEDADCADAMQETTIKVFNALPGLRKPRFFKTLVIRILINECNQLLRNRKRTISMAEVPEKNPTEGFEDSRLVELRDRVEQLDDNLRIVIELFYFRDMSIKQIAIALELTEGAVRTRLHRARENLMRGYLAANEGEINYESI